MNSLDNLDNISRHYDNIIIVSHCRDELVFFYDFITHRTLLILITQPASERELFIINDLVIQKGCELIVLDNINSFDTNFQLNQKTKDVLKIYSNYYGYEKFITQAKTTIQSDAVSRAVYDFVSSLQLDNHYIPEYNKTNKKITAEFNKYALKYAKVYLIKQSHIKNRILMFQNTYLSVSNLIKA
jgi:hypothetical protein